MERKKQGINNSFYNELGEEWYTSHCHPVALLRAENAVRTPWISEIVKEHAPRGQLLDIGCGAGLFSNPIAEMGLSVTGIDLSEPSLEIAKKYDRTKNVRYLRAPAEKLPFENASFDCVTALDLLEHVELPEAVVREAARVLKKDGLFFFHTFNRNFLSYLMVIKGVEWSVKGTPADMHLYRLFIKPRELEAMCDRAEMKVQEICGLRPAFSLPFFQMLLTRKVPQDFRFEFTRSLKTGYVGYARKL